MNYRWTPRRDRELQALRRDLFSYRDCAAILGGGCTAEQAKARVKLLREMEDTERGVRYEPQAPLHPVIGPDLEPNGRPVAEGVRPSTAAPRPVQEKIALPRYGEMEKRYDRFTRARLGDGQ
jgi:hypothetical protein